MTSAPFISQWADAMDACSEPVAALVQGGLVESVHRGVIAVVDRQGRVTGGVGDPSLSLFLRSAAKPFQALAVVESGAAEAFSLNSEELAVMCGSHAGKPEHVEVVERLLGRLGVTPEALSCGPLTHMCSGKHAGMIAIALHLGVSVEGYERPLHPVQQEIARVIRVLLADRDHDDAVRDGKTGLKEPSILEGTDGCGVPMIRTRVDDVAYLYALLAAGATRGLVQIREAMLAHPQLVAGEGRLDTVLMRAAGGDVVAKTGAEGIYALGLRAPLGGGGPTGGAVGIIVKVADGSARAVSPLVRACLQAFSVPISDDVFAQTRPRSPESIRGIVRGEMVSLVQDSSLRRVRGHAAAGGTSTVGSTAALPKHPADEADTKIVIGRGDERELLRFLRDEWPAADEETFGRPLQWVTEPFALIMKRRRRIIAVLRGHFTGGVGSVDELMVSKEERYNGIGSMLLCRFEREAEDRGCTRLVLRAVKDSVAESFYRGLGYHRVCVEHRHEFAYDYVRLTKELHSRGKGAR